VVERESRESDNTFKDAALSIEALQQQLDTAFFGREERLHYVPILDSTNTVATQLVQRGSASEGFVVLTDSQTAGRGRLGRQWVDSFGYNILSSTVLLPRFPLSLLVMLASLAVVDTIEGVCNIPATIKWPNDVLIGERKVAGILIETTHNRARQRVAIMGIGINVHSFPASGEQQPLITKAITLEEACGHRVSRETCIAQLLKHIEAS
jgi:BirA family biotin operon repressor/biotin-[acetyl-CoA-carboxylase] ligase